MIFYPETGKWRKKKTNHVHTVIGSGTYKTGNADIRVIIYMPDEGNEMFVREYNEFHDKFVRIVE